MSQRPVVGHNAQVVSAALAVVLEELDAMDTLLDSLEEEDDSGILRNSRARVRLLEDARETLETLISLYFTK